MLRVVPVWIPARSAYLVNGTCHELFDGFDQRLFLGGPAELVQLHPALERPLVSGNRVGKQVPDGPRQIRVFAASKNSISSSLEVMPHRGGVRANHG